MARNLTDQVRSISEVTKAVANGDLSKTVDVDVQGEMLELKTTVNQMVFRLSTLAKEVTRVSLEVGTEGIMGGQAYVPDVQGMWKVSRLARTYRCRGFHTRFSSGFVGQRQLNGHEFDQSSAFYRGSHEGCRRR